MVGITRWSLFEVSLYIYLLNILQFEFIDDYLTTHYLNVTCIYVIIRWTRCWLFQNHSAVVIYKLNYCTIILNTVFIHLYFISKWYIYIRCFTFRGEYWISTISIYIVNKWMHMNNQRSRANITYMGIYLYTYFYWYFPNFSQHLSQTSPVIRTVSPEVSKHKI